MIWMAQSIYEGGPHFLGDNDKSAADEILCYYLDYDCELTPEQFAEISEDRRFIIEKMLEVCDGKKSLCDAYQECRDQWHRSMTINLHSQVR